MEQFLEPRQNVKFKKKIVIKNTIFKIETLNNEFCINDLIFINQEVYCVLILYFS